LANNSSGPATVIAALILGMSILGAAFVLQGSMDRNSQKVAETLAAIAASASDLAKAGPAAGAAAPARPARAGRPDPTKVYQIAVGDSPARGDKNAAIKIVEWSDFQ
jgi:type II secretory pathway pseudopilin PulG